MEAMTQTIQEDQLICLVDHKDRRILLNTNQPIDKYPGIGVYDPKSLIGKTIGEQLQIGNKTFYLFTPSLMDKMLSIKRKAQIILPRDCGHIIMGCSIEPGTHVLESGIGSGSLTIALASIVGETGHVISIDNREDHIEHATKNIQRAGLVNRVTTQLGDVTKQIDHKDLDAIILDIPNPWEAIPHATKALKVGGYLCTYSPLTTQLEHTVQELNKHHYIELKTLENIQRDLVVSDHGTRPNFQMLGHTGYLLFARKTAEK